MRKTNHLQIVIFGLRRAAGPYRWAKRRHSDVPRLRDHKHKNIVAVLTGPSVANREAGLHSTRAMGRS